MEVELQNYKDHNVKKKIIQSKKMWSRAYNCACLSTKKFWRYSYWQSVILLLHLISYSVSIIIIFIIISLHLWKLILSTVAP